MQLIELLNEGQDICAGINGAYLHYKGLDKGKCITLSTRLTMKMERIEGETSEVLGVTGSEPLEDLTLVVNLLNTLKLILTSQCELESLLTLDKCFTIRYTVLFDNEPIYWASHHFDENGMLTGVECPTKVEVVATTIELLQ